jgi:DNA-binding phage protein
LLKLRRRYFIVFGACAEKRFHWCRSVIGKGVEKMALTRDFHETIVARVQRDSKFARALLDEAATLFLNGEPELAKTVLRDLVNATVGFEALAQAINKSPKSVHRMLSSLGNPTMTNLAAIFSTIRTALNVEFRARVVAVV